MGSEMCIRDSSITAQGVSKSDNEIAQKSWPIGAPTRAAQACSAEIPGDTMISILFQRISSLWLMQSKTRMAIEYMPGSPDDSRATVFPLVAKFSANIGLCCSYPKLKECVVLSLVSSPRRSK